MTGVVSEARASQRASVGARIRALRRGAGMSLVSVGAKVGISASFLSQIETGKGNASSAVLLSLADIFDVSLDYLLGRSDVRAVREKEDVLDPRTPSARSRDVVVRAEEAATIELCTGLVWSRLSDGGGDLANSLLVTYDPGSSDTSDGRLKTHAAWEYGYVVEGTLRLTLEFDVFDLHAGDSFHFDSERPHLFTNVSDEVARAVWFVVHKRGAEIANSPFA